MRPLILLVSLAAAGLVAFGLLGPGTGPRWSPGAIGPGRAQTPVAAPAGVHKCVSGDGSVVYSDRPCAASAQERRLASGTVTVLPAARPAPPAGSAGARGIEGFDPATVDRLREQQVDAAMKR